MSSISHIIASLKNMITFISLLLCHLFHHPLPDLQKSGRGPTNSVAASITGSDVGVVMRRLRLPHLEPFSQDSVENIEGIFEGVEPLVEEVREAFGMFDENDDGFVDAEELEKVMSSLGLVGLSQQECERMIMVFDDDGDGRISFGEFVKLIEESFCC
ncbi:probable calcium-binding protein CML46 [Salvia splendens]|uniref:probable calcium-binding protein CML46 n=1 Tax=Salvia splendens TaxID=180675 RepID=UPI001C2760AA|nr:probable calcium-binding protein CML46 [Salvia splendens]